MNHVYAVFLVDDDQDDRFFLSQAIREAGAFVTIVEAENGLELLTLLRQTAYDRALILLDMNMPKMNGLETIAALRADSSLPVFPVVMISTSANPALIETAYLAGADSFMTKPSSFEGFTALSQELITRFMN